MWHSVNKDVSIVRKIACYVLAYLWLEWLYIDIKLRYIDFIFVFMLKFVGYALYDRD